MATAPGSRDVTLTLSVETLGEDGIKQLQTAINALAKEGGAAGPEFQQLADELSRLSDQNAALQTFKQLTEATDVLRAKQESTAQTAQEMATRLDGLRVAATEAAARQKEAADALVAGQKAHTALGNKIRELKTEYNSAGKQTAEYLTKLNDLTAKQGEAKLKLIDLRSAQKDANSELTSADAAVNKLTAQYERNTKAADSATNALNEQEKALAKATEEAAKLGVTTDDLASAEGRLIALFNRGVTAVNERRDAIREMAESDRLLAIEEQGVLDLLKRGEQALQAETLAQRDAARASAEYAAAKARATEDSAAWQREAEAIVNGAEAAKRLARETEVLVTAQRELAEQDAFAKQAADAQKMLQAAEYVRFWEASLQEAENQARQTAAAAEDAAGKINNAFKTVGVRSAQDLEAEIAQVRSAMSTLAEASQRTGQSMQGAFAAGEAKIAALERDLRELNGTLTLGDKAAKLFANSMGQIASGNLVADGVGYLINKVKELGRAFLDVVVQGDQMRRGLNAVYGDTTLAARQIEFLRKSSSEAGVSFSGLTQEFVKFSASMKSANVPIEQSNALFKAVTTASASLGLSAETTAGTLNALGQMASKGTVSMEELRQQLGDRLPGALGLTAKGFGITEAELIKLVESGQLATRDFIGPFTTALNGLKGESDGLVPTWERLKGALASMANGIGDAGGVKLLTGALKVLGGTVATIALGFSSLVEGLLLVGSGVTALAARLTGDTTAWEFFAEQVEKSRLRLTEQADALNNMLDPSARVTEATQTQTGAMSENTAAVVKNINSNTELTASQKLAALSTALNADATLDASAKLVQFQVASAALVKTQEAQTEAASKLAKAAKEEGDVMMATAKLAGEEGEVRRVSAQAAQLHADALAKLSASHGEELAILTATKAELIANTKERGVDEQQIKTQVEALDAKIKKAQAEVEQSRQSAEAAQQEVEARKLSVQTYGDQSASVDDYRARVVDLRLVLDGYKAAQLQGLATEQDVRLAREQLADATVRYKDALTDMAEKAKQENEFKRDSLKVTADALDGEVRLYEAKAKSAQASGDLSAATFYETEAKRKKIEIDRIAIQVKEIELKLERAEIDIKLERLKLEEPENELKRKKLELELKLNEMKGKSIGSSKELLALQQQELERSVQFGNALGRETTGRQSSASTMSQQTSALERLNAEKERENAASEKAIALENKRRGVDAQGFSADANGNRINMGGDLTTRTGILNFLKSAGVTDDADARRITNEFTDNQGNVQFTNNPGQIKYNGSTLSQALLRAAEQYTFSDRNMAAPAQAPTQAATPASRAPALGTTVNINLNGATRSIRTDPAGAEALQNILSNLGTASRTAS